MSGLSDQQMQSQIDHMVNFIMKEGQEKAEEIDTKAGEDFNIEKVRLVQSEKKKMMLLHERRAKQAEVQKKIEYSNQLNQARLRVLKAQDDHLQTIFQQTRDALKTVTADAGKYSTLLYGVLLQSCLSLLEKDVKVRSRASDAAAVEGVFSKVATEYKKLTGMDLKLTLDSKSPLSEDCGGGVEVYIGTGAIKVTNTLQTRLDMACRSTLPAIRNILIGIGNGTRAFFD